VHEADRRIALWGGISDEETIRRTIGLGADAIGSDYPARLIACLGSAGLREG
jgi:hypothetical protein